MSVKTILEQKARAAIQAVTGLDLDPQVNPTNNPAHGDFQINGILAGAKVGKYNPRQVAAQVAEALAVAEMAEQPEVAGPGFINIRLKPEWLAGQLNAIAQAPETLVESAETPQMIIVDYSSPNIAKSMHVGHLRTTIIGDAIKHILRYRGHHVLGDNHLGDWGTQFGLLIYGYRHFLDSEKLEADPVPELERVYKLATAAAKADEAVATIARQELVKLQAGDPENTRLWQRFVDISRQSMDLLYGMLGVTFDLWLGESFYNDRLAPLVEELLTRGMAEESDGAIVVRVSDDPERAPFIIRKRDGGFNYATTDIACIAYRHETYKPHRIVYVVDSRQSEHFQNLFETARRLGYREELVHVGFGTILGEDGRPIKTREGEPVRLVSLLEEAIERAHLLLKEKDLQYEPEEEAAIARAVGIAAVKYADLSQNRLTDYKFDWSKLISFDGNTGPYLQYSLARIYAIFRKAGLEMGQFEPGGITLEHPTEIELAKVLLSLTDTYRDIEASLLPHLLCEHLYRLTRAFSAFYTECKVVVEDEAVKQSRLSLCRLTAAALEPGLECLGITPLRRM